MRRGKASDVGQVAASVSKTEIVVIATLNRSHPAKVETCSLHRRRLSRWQGVRTGRQIAIGINAEEMAANITAVIEAKIAVMSQIDQSWRICGGGHFDPQSRAVITRDNTVAAAGLDCAGEPHAAIRSVRVSSIVSCSCAATCQPLTPETVAPTVKRVTAVKIDIKTVFGAIDDSFAAGDAVDDPAGYGAVML